MEERRSVDPLHAIHERLLCGDPTASAELAELVFETLVTHLRYVFPKVRDDELLYDAATDAWRSYVKAPHQFDPERRGLLGYLKMAAEGDLRNARARTRRRRTWEHAVEDVELAASGGKKGARMPPHTAPEVDGDPVSLAETRARVESLFSDARDRQLAELVVANERSTAPYARVLGIDGRPPAEQRQVVKQHKDRIKKRLRRFGERNDELRG